MPKERKILLTFDVEEFDLPLEYNIPVSLEEQLSIGYNGLQELSPILNSNGVNTTLFTTAFFAENYPLTTKELSEKHEIASHTYSHTNFNEIDIFLSKSKLEEICNKAVHGIRMPRMKKIDPSIISAAGYTYNSSINPTWIPGRYNNLNISRQPFLEKNVLQFPVSVTPHIRIPLFWLAFKNFPYQVYLRMVLQTLRHDKYVCLYFHPWEFTDLSAYKLPAYVKRDPKKLLAKLKKLVHTLSQEGEFVTMKDYITYTSMEK